jgi:DNA-binding HxlR family transcriptional regulator
MSIMTNAEACTGSINAVRDALYVINGKWKLLVIVSLSEGARRFTEIERAIDGITPKVLSKELRELELNEFVERKVINSVPVQITYELTPYSDSLKEIIGALKIWGEQHKKYILKKRRNENAARVV